MNQGPPTQPNAMPTDPTPVRVAILISAIFNILSALAWAATCFGIIFSVPLIVLSIFEFVLFAKLGEPPYGPRRGTAQLIGILEICTIVLGNLPSMVCGIIVLVFREKLRD